MQIIIIVKNSLVPSLPGPPPPPSQQVATSQPTPVLLPAQFALSGNTLQRQQNHQQRQFSRQGKSISIAGQPDNVASSSNNADTSSVIDCGAGNDLGFCAASEKYPR